MSRSAGSSGIDLLRDETSRYASASSRASIAAQDSDSDESFWDDHESGEVQATVAQASQVADRKSERPGTVSHAEGIFSTKTVPEELADEVMSLLEHVEKSKEVPKEALETILAQVSNSPGGNSHADALLDYLNKVLLDILQVTTSLYDQPIQSMQVIPVEESSNEPETLEPETGGPCLESPREVTVQVFPTNQSLVEARFRERAGKSSKITSDLTRPSSAISSKNHSESKMTSGKSTGPLTVLSEIQEMPGMDDSDKLITLPMSKNGDFGFGDGEEEEIKDSKGKDLIMHEWTKKQSSCSGSLLSEEINASQGNPLGEKKVNAGWDSTEGRIGAIGEVDGSNNELSESRLVTMASMVASAATAAVTTAISKLNIGNPCRDPWRDDAVFIGTNSRQPSRPPTRQAQIVHTPCNPSSKNDKIGVEQVKIEHHKEPGADIATQTSDLLKNSQIGLHAGGGEAQSCYNVWQRNEEDRIDKTSPPCVERPYVVQGNADPVGMQSRSGEFENGIKNGAEPARKVELPEDLKDSIFRAMEDLNNLATGVPSRPIARFSLDSDDHQETVRCLNTTLGGNFDYSAVRNQLNSLRSGSELLSDLERTSIVTRKIRSDASPPPTMWAGIQTWKDMQAFQKGVRQEVEHRMNTPHQLLPDKHSKSEEKKTQSNLKLSRKPLKGQEQQEIFDLPPTVPKPITAAGLTQSQRLRRKRGTPEPSSLETPKLQSSRFPPKLPPRPPSPVNKKPRQRPRIAFGSRVEQQLEDPKSTPLNRTRPPPEPMARRISEPPEIPSSQYQGRVGKAKVERDAQSMAQSSCGDTEDLLVDGIMEALMRAARGFEIKTEESPDPRKGVKRVDSPQSTTHREDQNGDGGTEFENSKNQPKSTHDVHRKFLSISDIREPPLPDHQVQAATPRSSSDAQGGCVASRVTRSVSGAVEEWLVDEAVARLMMQTTNQAKQFNCNPAINVPDVPADSPALAALATEGLSQELENIWKDQAEESQVDSDQQGLDGVDDNILRILVDALMEARISEQEPICSQTPESAIAPERTPAPTPVPLSNEHLPKPIAYELEADHNTSAPKPPLQVVIPEAVPQTIQTTIQVSAAVEGQATQHDISEPQSVATSTPFLHSCTGTPMLSPHPRKPLTIKPHNDMDSSSTSDSGPSACVSDLPNTVASKSTEASSPEKSETEAGAPPVSHPEIPSEATSVHVPKENTVMLAKLAVSTGHGVFEVSAGRVERDSDVSISSPKVPVGESSTVPILRLDGDGDPDLAGPKPTLERFLPPGPPPGYPMSLHQFCGGARRLWRPPPQEENRPPSTSDFYGSAEDSSSTDSHYTKVDRNDIGKYSRFAGPSGFRLNQYRARRRYLMEKAGIDDPLLMSGSSLGSGTSSETSDDRSLCKAAAIYYKSTSRDVKLGHNYPAGGDLDADV